MSGRRDDIDPILRDVPELSTESDRTHCIMVRMLADARAGFDDSFHASNRLETHRRGDAK
jgi:hypothetical protein